MKDRLQNVQNCSRLRALGPPTRRALEDEDREGADTLENKDRKGAEATLEDENGRAEPNGTTRTSNHIPLSKKNSADIRRSAHIYDEKLGGYTAFRTRIWFWLEPFSERNPETVYVVSSSFGSGGPDTST